MNTTKGNRFVSFFCDREGFVFFIITLFCVIFLFSERANAIPQIEREALIALYEDTDGDNWINNTGWNDAPGTECTWNGITCEGDKVTQVSLYTNNLVGSIPPEIGNLTDLKILNLYNNQLSGPVPSGIWDLGSLERLFLRKNKLTGSIPPEIGNLTNLEYFELRENQLTGSIPSEIGNLTNLRYLSVRANQLRGAIPSSITNLTFLDYLYLEYNGFFSNETIVRDFLGEKNTSWEDTQTIAPKDFSANFISDVSVTLSWTPIIFTDFTGGYRVFVATQPGGPYALYGESTNKSADTMVVNGLTPGVTYYFVIQTWTDPHASNQNMIESQFSGEVQVATLLSLTDSDSDGLYDDLENTRCTAFDNHDTDGDGISDGVEDANHNGIQDGVETNPCLFDTDSDGLSDGQEFWAGTDPLLSDTDGDGVLDGADVDPLNTLLGTFLGRESDLADIFRVAALGHAPGAERSAIMNISFDGSGSLSMTGLESDNSVGSDLPVDGGGAYVLETGGLGFISAGDSTLDLVLNRTKDVLIAADVRDDTWQEIALGLLAGGSGYSDSTLSGPYYFTDLYRSYDWNSCEIGTITFDGAGEFDVIVTSSQTGGSAGIIDSYSGVYAMDGDGTVGMQTLHPRTVTGGVSSDAGIFVGADVSNVDEQGLWFGVKAGSSGYSAASLMGTYYMVDYTVNTGGVYSSMNKLVFDGFGVFLMEQLFNHDATGANQAQSGSGTYSVNDDGTFTFNMGGEITNAALSRDAQSFISARVDVEDVQGISFGFRVIPSGCDPDDDNDVDGLDLNAYAQQLPSGTNTISLEEFVANFGQ